MSQQTTTSPVILVVDDEEAILLSIDTTLRMAGWNEILTCSDSRQVLGILQGRRVDMILLDLNMPHLGGEDLLLQINRDLPQVPVIVVTGAMEVDTAVHCMKSGAFDYIVKPVEEARLLSAVTRAAAFRELERENLALKQHLLTDAIDNIDAFGAIVTGNRKMLAIFRYIESIAGTSRPVLVSGETGVGKELVAQAMHVLSGVKGRFVAVNVAGLDDNVFSDTLFGHARGAFTGAEFKRRGLIENASGGTLFLDEIGDLSPGSQVKLLRLLQEGEYLPLGKDEPRHSDARIVASTHSDLWTLENEGKFRKDLIYRLSTHHVEIPPLRRRRDDIPLLVNHFLEKAAGKLERKKLHPPPELLALLERYEFPGNVRELEAMIFDAATRQRSGTLSLEVFHEHISRQAPAARRPPRQPSGQGGELAFPDELPTIREATRMLVREALKRTGGNQTLAARLLGISQQALSKRIKNQKKDRDR